MFECIPTTTIESRREDDPYRALAFGIVQGNIDQLNCLLRRQERVAKHPDSKMRNRDLKEMRDIEQFFYSDWFIFLVQDKIDGPRLYRRLISNFNEHGDVYEDHTYKLINRK